MNRFGSRSRNERIAEMAASRRVGSTSSARIEPETSTTSITVALSSGTLRCVRGRASAPGGEREREQEEHERHPAPHTSASPPPRRPARRGSCRRPGSARAAGRSTSANSEQQRDASSASRKRGDWKLTTASTSPRAGPRRRCRPGEPRSSRSRPTPSCRPASACTWMPSASSKRANLVVRNATRTSCRRAAGPGCSRSWSSRPMPGLQPERRRRVATSGGPGIAHAPT